MRELSVFLIAGWDMQNRFTDLGTGLSRTQSISTERIEYQSMTRFYHFAWNVLNFEITLYSTRPNAERPTPLAVNGYGNFVTCTKSMMAVSQGKCTKRCKDSMEKPQRIQQRY